MDHHQALLVGRLDVGLFALVPEAVLAAPGSSGQPPGAQRIVFAGGNAFAELFYRLHVGNLHPLGAGVQRVEDVLLGGGGHPHHSRQPHTICASHDIFHAFAADGAVLTVDYNEVHPRPSDHLRHDGVVELIKHSKYSFVILQSFLQRFGHPSRPPNCHSFSSSPISHAGLSCIITFSCSSVAPHRFAISFANFSSPSVGAAYTACPMSESTTIR